MSTHEDARREDRDRYIESLAADIYWAGEQWFRKVDPYHSLRPVWPSLASEYKTIYREIAEQLITEERDAESKAAS